MGEVLSDLQYSSVLRCASYLDYFRRLRIVLYYPYIFPLTIYIQSKMKSQTMELLFCLVILSIPGGFLKTTSVKLYFALAPLAQLMRAICIHFGTMKNEDTPRYFQYLETFLSAENALFKKSQSYFPCGLPSYDIYF